MVVVALFAALRQLVSPPLRRILWRSIGVAAVIVLVLWLALSKGVAALLAGHPISASHPVVDTLVTVLSSFGVLLVLIYFMPAVAALVAGFFADDAALIVERTDFPNDAPGEPISFARSIGYGLRFAAISLAVNLFALILLVIPGINIAAFAVAFALNAYLLGREYYEMAALRFVSPQEATARRRRFSANVLLGGAAAAAVALIPIVNLVTPLFATALMVNLHKRTARRLLAGPGDK